MSFSVRYAVSPKLARRVWAAVSAEPCASTRELADMAGCAHSSVRLALRRLRDVGYIDFPDGASRARRVIVPFVVVAYGDTPVLVRTDATRCRACDGA